MDPNLLFYLVKSLGRITFCSAWFPLGERHPKGWNSKIPRQAGLYVLFNPDMGVVASVYPSAPLYKPDRRDYLDVNTPDGMEQDFSFSYEKGMDQYLRDMERYKPYTCDIGPTKYAYDLEEAKALAEKYLLSTGAILTTVEIE